MKSAFVLHHAVVAVAYPAAFAAEAAGLFPASVFSLPVLAGYYVAAGVLALACDDYRRGEAGSARRHGRILARPARASAPRAVVPSWAARTYST